jgi:peptide/nickel transport system substrate-binding protein
VKFRQACAYAIDQENVMKMAVRGYGVMNPSLVPIQSQYYTPFHKKWYKKDADKAKELLKEMGYKGEEIVIDVSKKYMWHYNQVVAIQSDLAAVGIKSRINVIEWSTLMEKFYNGDFQILSTSATARPEPQLAYSILIPYGFEEKYPRMTKIRAEIEGTMDIKTRKNLFEEAHALHYEGVPCIVLYWKSSLAAHWDYVKGFKLPWTTGLPFWGVWLDK